MKILRKCLALVLALVMVFSLSAAVLADDSGDVTILYTNDVHTYINKDLTYALVAAYRDTLDNVLLVDAGDHIQGTAYGGMDSGATIIQLMNAARYDLATLGNHEFDYGMEGCMNAIDWAEFPYVSCNFYHEQDGVVGDSVLDSYKVFEVAGLKIAFVGITTPESFTKSTPAYFQDDEGNYIYGIAGGTDGSELYAAVQEAIDAASAEADVVIALGHLGIDPSSQPWTSEDVIANTTGLDAFIDGHSHSTVPMKEVTAKDGSTVVLTQTGCYLSTLGKMTITADGTITTELLTAEDLADVTPDADVKAIEDAWITQVDEMLGEKIASSEIDFTINGADGSRAVRTYETNLGDFNADAYYWYSNMVAGLDCDIAIMNGGGIRANADSGDWSYLTCKTVNTFGNVLCVVKVSGQAVLDALEFGSRYVGVGENGGFLQVAGITYDVDITVENTVQTDDKSVWLSGPTEYRVSNVQVYNKETGEYEPLELDKIYTMAGTNYTLLNCGDGFNMFGEAEKVLDGTSEDYLALAAYAKAFADVDGDGYGDIATANSPLTAYEGYLMNYESSTGAGRITTIREPFTDVTESDWFYDYVAELYLGGVINGMTETTFVPSGELTWGQALKLLLVSSGVMEDQGVTGDNWFAPYVEKAQELGLIETVDGAEAISRLDFCTVAAKLYELEPVADYDAFTDCSDGYVGALVEAGVIDGFAETDGSYTFRGEETLQRDQISKIICLLLDLASAE